MKKLLLAVLTGIAGILLYPQNSRAGDVIEEPIQAVGSLQCVSISTSAFTKIPSGDPTSGRHGLFINNLSTNTAKMVIGVVNAGESAPSGSVGGLKVSPATDMLYFPASEFVTVYLKSLHTAAETACVLEIKQ